jgi:hypothetical protein
MDVILTFLRIHSPVLLSFFALSIFASFLYRRIHTSKKGIENKAGSNSGKLDKSDRSDRFVIDKMYPKSRNNEMIINMIHHDFPPDDADIHQLRFFLILYMKIYFK